MGSLFARGSKLYAKTKNVAGKWMQIATGLSVGDEAKAAEWLADLERTVDTQRAAATELGADPGAITLAAYAKEWLAERDTETANDDRGRLDNHILPALGQVQLANLRPRHVRDFIERLRTTRKLGNMRKDGTRVPTDEPIAPRTVLMVYGTLRVMLNDALADELIATSPCVLKSGDLPAKVDKDRTWRRTAVFTRDEVETVISAPPAAVPADRRVMYAIMFLAAMRFGEAAALTWRDYDAAAAPLGRLVIEKSYSSKSRTVKGTKTENPREMPVHPTLARILAEWKLSGFEAFTGRQPKPEDLIVPSRRGKSRNVNHMLRRFHEDLERIGLRARRQHDARRTFISVARADGARPDILRWSTHGPTGDITDQYTTLPWATLCEEVAKARFGMREGRVIEMPIAVAVGATTLGQERDLGFGAAVVQPQKPLISLLKLAERTRLEGARFDAPRRSAKHDGECAAVSVPRLSVVEASPSAPALGADVRSWVDTRIEAALAAWRRTGDRVELRRALLKLDTDLGDDDSDAQ